MARRFQTEISKERRKWRIIYWVIAITLAVAILVILISLFFLKLPLWRVKGIDIQGNSYIPKDKIESLILAHGPGKSKIDHLLGPKNILAWQDEISAADLDLFLPEAKSITLEKSYFSGRITAKVVARGHDGIWCFRSTDFPSCYWFDRDGLVSRAPANEGSLLLVVNDYSRAPVARGESLLRPEFLPNLFSIFEALKHIDVNPKEIRLDNLILEELAVPTYEGPTLYFSLRFPADNTPAAFTALKDKTSISKLQYIDFRVENRIYFK